MRYQSADDLRADLMRFGRGRPLVGAAAVAAVAAPVAAEPPTVAAVAAEPQAEIWDDREPRRVAPAIATGLGLALLIGVIVYVLFFLGKGATTAPTAKVEVPNVVGQSYDSAVAEHRGLGLQGHAPGRAQRRAGRPGHHAAARGRAAGREGPHRRADGQREAGSRPERRRARPTTTPTPRSRSSGWWSRASTRRRPTSPRTRCCRRAPRPARRSTRARP